MTDKCQGNVKSRNHDRIYRGLGKSEDWEERKRERERDGKSGGVVKRGRVKSRRMDQHSEPEHFRNRARKQSSVSATE